MARYSEPVKVDIGVENPTLERGAFYNLCFIAENNSAPRTLEVDKLSDLLENGYSRLDLAYNFCVGVFAQQGISRVYVRAKRSGESYIDSYNSDDNGAFYFIVLQSKKMPDIIGFSNFLNENSEMKLHFYSQKQVVKGKERLVSYFQEYTPPSEGVIEGSKDYYINKAYLGVGSTNTPSSVTITGVTEVGSTLTPVIRDVDGLPSSGITYSWLSNGVEVSTTKNYRIRNSDYNKTLKVKVSFIDKLGSSEVAVSPSSKVVSKATLPDYLLDNRSISSVEYAIQKLHEKLQG